MKAEWTKSSVAAFVVLCFFAVGLQAQINGMSIGESSGSYVESAGTYTLTDGSTDIWNNADGFQFVYQKMSGDGQITVRAYEGDVPHGWAKRGIMIRENLAANSRHAMIAISGDGRTAFQHRKTPGMRSYSAHGEPNQVTAPHWLRIERIGNTFTGYHSHDGVNWTQQENLYLDGGDPDARNPANINMPENVYVGLCLTSHDPDTTATAVFDNVTWPALPPVRQPLWRPFWFLDAKLLLYYTPYWTYRYTGFWGGWYPYYYFGRYYYPWYGPVFCHPCCWPLRWHYWWWRWPWSQDCRYAGYKYQDCWWWWHPWRGGPYFWGFLDRLRYRWWHPNPKSTFWWSWYWIYNDTARCLEVVTLADASEGGIIRPLDKIVFDNLEIETHDFDVNGGRHKGNFSALERVSVAALREYYLALGATQDDLADFENSGVYQNLLQHSEPNDEVLVQWAEFPVDQPEILITQPQGSPRLTEGSQHSYEISLASPPDSDVVVVAEPNVNAGRIDLGNGPGSPVTVNFPAGDPGPRTITITAMEDTEQQRNELAVVTHTVLSEDPQYAHAELPAVPVGIEDNELGAWGFLEGDINRDGNVNFKDVSIVADSWLGCTDPNDPDCAPAEPYAPPEPGQKIPGTGWWGWGAWTFCSEGCTIGPNPSLPQIKRCKPNGPCPAGCSCRVFRSNDGGKTWEYVKYANKKGDFGTLAAGFTYRCWCVK